MVKKYEKSIFIFRREHRLKDNIGLIEALKQSNHVIPIFIFTPEQLINNLYKSNNAVQFMMESLDDLEEQLKNKGYKLTYFFGKPHKIINEILDEHEIDAIFTNRDYTVYSKNRDCKIKKICDRYNTTFNSFEDYLLHPVGSIRSGNNNIYTKFTPYFDKAKKVKVNEVILNNHNNYYNMRFKNEFKGNKHDFYKFNKCLAINGGRQLALNILKNIEDFKNYNNKRNMLNENTTRLSAYLKFGCVSIREVYYTFKNKLGHKNDLIRQLFWREFYYNICEYNPRLLGDDIKLKNYDVKYSKVPWIVLDKANSKQKELFKKLISGKSGIPVIDAAVKELVTTGFMHNRARLLFGDFLIKHCNFHWIEGEKFFSHHLVDYDPIINGGSGNWAWLCGAAPFSQPYYRVFNPFRQQKLYDPKCEYIKKWLPELKGVPADDLHEWNIMYKNYNVNYPKPIIDINKSAKKAIQEYKKALY
jgi:deoxyribodipyrimidine photo-lyase